jgi:hypothetical protein
VTLAFLAGGCFPFAVPGYRGRAVEYVARAEEGSEAALPSPRLVRTEGVRIVFYPFRSEWLPRVDLTLPAQHQTFLTGWIWIESTSRATVRIGAPSLRTPVGVALETRVLVPGGEYSPGAGSAPALREHPLPPGDGLWIRVWLPIARSFGERFELWFAWWEDEQEHGIPVAFARQEP